MDKKSFKKDIDIQLQNLERLAKEMNELIDKIDEEPDFTETRAGASIIHDFYSGVEKIFKRIAVNIDKNLPADEDWHSQLLLQMSIPIKGVRDSVISESLFKEFKEYLRFRHLFRNIYGFELKWKRFKNLSFSLSDVLAELKKNLKKFTNQL
jgi:hypothetical protein